MKSVTVLLGPIVEVFAFERTAVSPREVDGVQITDPDVVHLMARHHTGAISLIGASHVIEHYQRPGDRDLRHERHGESWQTTGRVSDRHFIPVSFSRP